MAPKRVRQEDIAQAAVGHLPFVHSGDDQQRGVVPRQLQPALKINGSALTFRVVLPLAQPPQQKLQGVLFLDTEGADNSTGEFTERAMDQVRHRYEFLAVPVTGIDHAHLVHSLKQRPHRALQIAVLNKPHLLLDKLHRFPQVPELLWLLFGFGRLVGKMTSYVIQPQGQVTVLEIVQLLQHPARQQVASTLKKVEDVAVPQEGTEGSVRTLIDQSPERLKKLVQGMLPHGLSSRIEGWQSLVLQASRHKRD